MKYTIIPLRFANANQKTKLLKMLNVLKQKVLAKQDNNTIKLHVFVNANRKDLNQLMGFVLTLVLPLNAYWVKFIINLLKLVNVGLKGKSQSVIHAKIQSVRLELLIKLQRENADVLILYNISIKKTFAQLFQNALSILLLILILFHANVRIKIKKLLKMNAEIRLIIIALKDRPLILNF